MMLNDLETKPQKQNWASLVRDLLCRSGFQDVWFFKCVVNINIFLNTFKSRMRDMFMQDWHSRLENSTRARFYLNIENFQYQKYLDILTVQKYRISLSRLRLSSHRLEIEMGRWAKPNKVPLDNRKCKICNVVEDEFHFIL